MIAQLVEFFNGLLHGVIELSFLRGGGPDGLMRAAVFLGESLKWSA